MKVAFSVAALAIVMLVPALGVGLPASALDVKLQQVAAGLVAPLGAVHSGDGTGRLFLIEQRGTVRVLDDGVLQPGNWLDVQNKALCCGERGLLGLAFHPDFETNGKVFISYTREGDGASVLEKLTVASPPLGSVSPNGEILLVQSQPFANHNGGGIAFGPDGFLYFALGDGGNAGDPQNNGQNLNTLLGKMLRIDVDVPTGYAIPATNPFVGVPNTKPEIWSYGLRNPWRWSFDRATGDLWIADVGQNLNEEINLQAAGAAGGTNYGWRVWEGHLPFTVTQVANANSLAMTFPIMEYPHGADCSVTGGYVYRGAAVPELQGKYLFGDFCSGLVRLGEQVGNAYVHRPLLATTFDITSFGEDESGEVYLVHQGGTIHKFVPA